MRLKYISNYSIPVTIFLIKKAGGDMKRLIIPAAIIFLFAFSTISAQNQPIYKMIGKNCSEVKKIYGKPKKHDASNKSMECVFYKNKFSRMVFVGNESGVFQAELNRSFSSKEKAESFFEDYLSNCEKDGFKKDSIDVYEYDFRKSGKRVNISMFHNRMKKKYEVGVKAKKSG